MICHRIFRCVVAQKRKRINVEDKDKKGRTPFHYACNNGHLEIAGGTREVALESLE